MGDSSDDLARRVLTGTTAHNEKGITEEQMCTRLLRVTPLLAGGGKRKRKAGREGDRGKEMGD